MTTKATTTTTYQRPPLPQDVILRCIPQYLETREKYKLFSLCKITKTFLHHLRTIHIQDVDLFDNREKLLDSNNWTVFESSEEHRRKLFAACGLDCPENKNTSMRRPFRLSITHNQLVKSKDIIVQYVEYFSMVIVTFNRSSIKELSSETILHNPTIASFSRFLQSTWHTVGDSHNVDNVITLQDMWDVAQQVSCSLLPPSTESVVGVVASFATLRGIHRLWLQNNNLLFVEISPDSNTHLQSVVLEQCHHIVDLTSLRHVPEVKLNICSELRDVSPLAHADHVQLFGLRVMDVSALDSVRKLNITKCKDIQNDLYPIPTITTYFMANGEQDWTFNDVPLSNEYLSKLTTLQKLTLQECDTITAISMLGDIQYLTVDNCKGLVKAAQFPSALIGQGQHWAFQHMDIVPELSPEYSKFTGFMNTLRLQLYDMDMYVSNIKCFSTAYVSNEVIEHIMVDTLKFTAMSNFIKFGNKCYISHLDIQLRGDAPLELTFSASVKNCLDSLILRNRNGIVVNELYRSDLVTTGLLIVDVGGHSYQSFTNRKEQQSKQNVFTNESLRTAVELWCQKAKKAEKLYGHISTWDVSQVTDMSNLFHGQEKFNININNWDVHNVTNMNNMFRHATAFNQSVTKWNVSQVTNMSCMFFSATSFNKPVKRWNVRKVMNMSAMFTEAASFNQPLNDWDVSNVTEMSSMFSGSTCFNQSLNTWNVSNVKDMSFMFSGAASFNQSLNTWNVSNVKDMSGMFYGATSFNQPLNTWNVSNVTDMNSLFRCASEFNQGVNNWDVSNVTDMNFVFLDATSFNQPINNWNVRSVTKMSCMFHNAAAFNQPLNDWHVDKVTWMGNMFNGATSFNQPLHLWNVSQVQNMSEMFRNATMFNQPLNSWNVGNVTDMSGMFYEASVFNQPLNNWNVSNVSTMGKLFCGTTAFNQPLHSWNVSKVVRMNALFKDATSFNQPLNNWDVSNVTDTSEMFSGAVAFNQPLDTWNLSNVQNINNMFYKATSFNQELDLESKF